MPDPSTPQDAELFGPPDRDLYMRAGRAWLKLSAVTGVLEPLPGGSILANGLVPGTDFGVWQNVPFNPATIIGESPMTVTVATQVMQRHLRLNQAGYWAWAFRDITVGGTTTREIRITLPAPLVVAPGSGNHELHGEALDNGVMVSTLITLNDNRNYAAIKRLDNAKWTLSAGLTAIFGSIAFPVQ